jgi:hypothetical protein
MCHYTMDELREITPVDIKPEVTPEQFEALLAPLRSGKKLIQQFNTVHRRKNGSDYKVSVSLQLLQDENRPVFLRRLKIPPSVTQHFGHWSRSRSAWILSLTTRPWLCS